MDAITRRRVTHHALCRAWTGDGAFSTPLPEHSGLAQHQFSAACSVTPSAGTLIFSIRPIGAGFFAPLGSIDLSVHGSGSLFAPALFDAASIHFSVALTSGAVNASVASVGTVFQQATNSVDAISRRRVVSSQLRWTTGAAITLNGDEHSGLTQHQFAAAGGTGTFRLLGRPIGGTDYVGITTATESLDAAGCVVIFPGLYDAFRLAPVGTVSGTIMAQLDSIGETLFFT